MERIEAYMGKRAAEGTLRKLSELKARYPARVVESGRELIDFSSNDYLGLSNDDRLIAAARQGLDEWGTGSGASRLMSGSLAPHHCLEAETACFKGKEDALVFNSGYQANISLIPALVGRGDVIFADRLCHASQIDGAVLSGAKLFRYKHNNIESLACLLKREREKYREALLLTESVFSMDGDIALLADIIELKKHFNCKLLLDEAHAVGAFGRGMAHRLGLTAEVDIVMGTFSKAFGSFGAYAACSRVMKEYFINNARGFIYSTSLPATSICASIAALKIVAEHPDMSIKLQENAAYLRQGLSRQGWPAGGESQILPVIVKRSETALKLSQKLREAGLRVLAVRPPTVPRGTARLRFSLCLAHSKRDLDYTLEVMDGLRQFLV
ncbi:MAG: 8-amino-7-oxononanoate synthase [bacterium]|jgi:8-amino-7-oxononanoate synthase|nr:8-amino-7-oxononanoate synthase [bacterium]MDD3805021.1 8-amino-7-oxononanoate synthase [bacterium]MDD4558438.1 8-amino-7-oxononanoate synthase [bacterium]